MAWYERWRDRGRDETGDETGEGVGEGVGEEIGEGVGERIGAPTGVGAGGDDRAERARGSNATGVPPAVGFLSEAEWASLGRAVDAHLEERGVDYRREGAELQLAEPNARASLVNLAHRCRQTPLEQWPQLVARHFAPLLDAAPDDLLPADPFVARGALRVRIVGNDWLDRIPPSDDVLVRSIAPGLVAVLFADVPGAIATVSPEDLARWQLSPLEAFDLGFDNVRLQEPVEVVHTDLGKGVDGTLVVGDSHFVATSVVWLDDLLDVPTRQGALVILPHRHAVVVHPLRHARAASLAIHRLAELAATMHGEGPGSLSSAVYWWRIGQLERLRTQLRPGGMTLRTTEDFDRMMRTLPR